MCKRVSTARLPIDRTHGLLDVGPRRWEPDFDHALELEEAYFSTPRDIIPGQRPGPSNPVGPNPDVGY